jgi:DNA-directed RNA polymerase sigma subunit (sigma70/sigma32)
MLAFPDWAASPSTLYPMKEYRRPLTSQERERRFNEGMERAMRENPGARLTLEQIANYGGCTRERVRQIESKALRKLRNRPQVLRMLGEARTERD